MINEKLAGVLSFLIPGSGQILCGEFKKGGIFVIIMILLHIIVAYFINNRFGSLINIVFSLYAAFDAYKLAKAV